jgi:hypothetical protein
MIHVVHDCYVWKITEQRGRVAEEKGRANRTWSKMVNIVQKRDAINDRKIGAKGKVGLY